MLSVAGEEDEDLDEQDTFLARLIPAKLHDPPMKPWIALALNRSLLTTAASMCLMGIGRAAWPFFRLYVSHKFDYSLSKVSPLSTDLSYCANIFSDRSTSSRDLS